MKKENMNWKKKKTRKWMIQVEERWKKWKK